MHRFSITTVAMLVANGLACDCFAGERRSADHAPPELAEPVRADAGHHADLDRLLELFREENDAGTLLITRDKWPRGVPVRFRIRPPRRAGDLDRAGYSILLADCRNESFADLVVRSVATSLRAILGPGPYHRVEWRDETYGIPATCVDDEGNVEFNVIVRAPSSNDDRPMASETMSFNVRLVDSINDILQPVPDPMLKGRLAASTTVILMDSREGPAGPAQIRVRLPLDLPSDLSVAFKMEVLAGEAEQVLGTARFVTTERYRDRQERDAARGETLSYLALDFQTDLPDGRVIEIAKQQPVRARLTSDPEYALRDFENARYWHGSFTVEVEVVAWDH